MQVHDVALNFPGRRRRALCMCKEVERGEEKEWREGNVAMLYTVGRWKESLFEM